MSRSQDIRQWLAEQDRGGEVAERGRLPNAIVEEYEAANGNGHLDDEPLLIVPDDVPGEAVAGPAPAEAGQEPIQAERPPKPPQERRGILSRKPRDKGKAPARRHLPRVSVANLISSGWGLGAMALMRNPGAAPIGRVMTMQAPVAGEIVDGMVKGTAVDKLLQPLARAGERGEKAVALVGPPLITGMIVTHPEWYPALRPMLKMALMSWMQVSAPAMKKAQERAARFDEELGDVDLDGMINALFSDIDIPTAPSPAEEANIRKARGD